MILPDPLWLGRGRLFWRSRPRKNRVPFSLRNQFRYTVLWTDSFCGVGQRETWTKSYRGGRYDCIWRYVNQVMDYAINGHYANRCPCKTKLYSCEATNLHRTSKFILMLLTLWISYRALADPFMEAASVRRVCRSQRKCLIRRYR